MEITTLLLSIASIITSLLGSWIVYRQYKAEVDPSLDVHIPFVTNETYKKICSSQNKIDTIQEGIYGYLWVQLVNTGRRAITPISICTDTKKETIGLITKGNEFGHELQDGQAYKHFLPLNIKQIKKIQNAKKIYIQDSRKKKHFLPSKEFKQLFNNVKDFS